MASPNWHWKSKLVTPWAKSWFEQELKITVQGDGDQQVSVTDVQVLDGDVELGQRKSKLIAIYDIHIKLSWSGRASDGCDVDGKLDIPEVSHEITLDKLNDYTYSWEMATTSSSAAALLEFAKGRLIPALEAKFAEFPSVLMNTHGKDITVSTSSSQEPSRAATPVIPPPSGNTNPNSAALPKPPATQKSLNTTSLVIEANFMASASDMFSILTDEKRIPQWSRNSAVSDPTPGSSYSLFGGGVKGNYSSVSVPTNFVQTWALQHPTWPTGHFATLSTSIAQSTDSTKVSWTMTGVPVGMEDEIQRNLQGYYIGGLKSIGLASAL